MPAPNVSAPAIDLLPPKLRRTLAAGLMAQVNGDYAEAMRCYLVAARREPDNFLPLYFAALVCFQLRNQEKRGKDFAVDRAMRLMYRSLQLHPTHTEAWYNLGKFYQDRGNLGKAVEAYVAALENKPDYGPALVNAGNVYWELGDEQTAEELYTRALTAKDGGPEAVYNLSFLMHLKGQWPDAFVAQEARWDCAAYYREYSKPFMELIPRWRGEQITNGALLLHGEQGHGDIVQMLRYVRQLQSKIAPAPLVIGVLDGLVRLVQTSFPDIRVVGTDGNISDCVAHLPSISLPLVMQTSWENPPPTGPYLRTGQKKPQQSERFRIGLCWAGSPTHPRDYVRSAKFSDVAPLLTVPGVEWINLQMGPRAGEWKYSHPAPIATVGESWDYLTTAEHMETCDLIITVDTSVAHVAAAMGLPTWMLCPRFPDVRWMLGRSDTPWYTDMLIFRQTKPGQWGEAVSLVRQMLEMKVQFRGAGL